MSLKELEIAGIAMIRYIYNSDYHYAIIQAQPCDPNLLGLISDFLIQVDELTTCVVFNQLEDGYKFSVRSCAKKYVPVSLHSFWQQVWVLAEVMWKRQAVLLPGVNMRRNIQPFTRKVISATV